MVKIVIIDGHMHISQWESRDGKSGFDVIRKYQQENGIIAIDNMCCSNNATLWDSFEADQNILGAIAKIENSSIFTHGCLYIPDNPPKDMKFNVKNQLEEMMEIGFDGVKICDFKPDAYKLFNVEEHLEEYDEYIGLCEKYGVHMCWHVADPTTFWEEDKVSEYAKKAGWFYGDGKHASYERLIDLAYVFIDRHPNLNVTLAHMFFKGKNPDEMISLFKKYPNVTIDFAPGTAMFSDFMLNHEAWSNIFRKYSDRFLYATDATLGVTSESMANEIVEYVQKFLATDEKFTVSYSPVNSRGVKLEKEHLENILYKNHQRIVGMAPRKINKPALKKHISRYLPGIPDSKNKRLTEEYYRKNLL